MRMKKSIMEEFEEIKQQAADLQKQLDEYEGVKHVDVVCECEGTGFIAVADNVGEDINYIECAKHNKAYEN